VIKTDIFIAGGGPAGLAAAIRAAEYGANVIIAERDFEPGGQLTKQTHSFFGSKDEYAGTRGIKIAEQMQQKVQSNSHIELMLEATVQGYYEDDVITVSHENEFKKIKADKFIIATGAAEKMLSFSNNDLPGVYGAGAVQTLMNIYGVVPGKRVLMIGSGNIGLIVSYQLLQAGVKVAGIVEAMPEIGGYLVHAAKIRRAGVPIYTGYTIKKALGKKCVRQAVISKLDKDWNEIANSEEYIDVDTICLAVGLRPLIDLLLQAGCKMVFIPELGGDVPLRDDNLRTTNEKIYVAGDVDGIEEATAAILEGELAALSAVIDLGYAEEGIRDKRQETKEKLYSLRKGPVGEKIRSGLNKVRGVDYVTKDRYSHIR